MEPIKEELNRIMAKYLENRASEEESIMLMNALSESQELREEMNLMAAGLNSMMKRRCL